MKYYILSCAILLSIFYYGYHTLKDNLPKGAVKRESILNSRNSNSDTKTYKSYLYNFTITLPKKYSINENYSYISNYLIKGISFKVDDSDYSGTNLSKDSYISVEKIDNTNISCSVDTFLNNHSEPVVFEELNNHIYSIATSSEAAAGNRYDQKIFVTPVVDGCIAVRYFIHYSAFENYPEGAIKEFNVQALLNKFDSIRKSLVIY